LLDMLVEKARKATDVSYGISRGLVIAVPR